MILHYVRTASYIGAMCPKSIGDARSKCRHSWRQTIRIHGMRSHRKMIINQISRNAMPAVWLIAACQCRQPSEIRTKINNGCRRSRRRSTYFKTHRIHAAISMTWKTRTSRKRKLCDFTSSPKCHAFRMNGMSNVDAVSSSLWRVVFAPSPPHAKIILKRILFTFPIVFPYLFVCTVVFFAPSEPGKFVFSIFGLCAVAIAPCSHFVHRKTLL